MKVINNKTETVKDDLIATIGKGDKLARSRKHIEKYYDMSVIGKFPDRLVPIPLRPKLTDLPSAIDYDTIYDELMNLNLAVYIPTAYLLDSSRDKYIRNT